MQFLGIIFLVLMFLEFLSIIWVAKFVGGLATLGLMILCFMSGSFLMKRSQGLSQLILATSALRNGNQISLYQMLYPIRIPIAAFFLMIPGFFLDVMAIILLLPLGGHRSNDTQQSMFGNFQYQQQQHQRKNRMDEDDIIEGEFTTVQDNKSNTRKNHQRLYD